MDNPLEKLASKTATIGMIGMGHVGLPLAVEFGRKCPVVGFEIEPERVAELTRGEDSTLEVDPAELRAVPLLAFTGAFEELEARQRLYRHQSGDVYKTGFFAGIVNIEVVRDYA